MLDRRATLSYGVKELPTNQFQKSPHLGMFFLMLRAFNVMSALAIMTLAFAEAVLVESTNLQGTYATSPRTAGRAASFIALAVMQMIMAFLIVATDGLHFRCVARYFGFMAVNVAKGLYSIMLGLLVIWIGFEYKDDAPRRNSGRTNNNNNNNANYNGIALTSADVLYLITIVVGCITAFVGLITVLVGWMKCVESTSALKREFQDYAIALRLYHDVYKRSDKTHEEQVTIMIARSEDGSASIAAAAAEHHAEPKPAQKPARTKEIPPPAPPAEPPKKAKFTPKAPPKKAAAPKKATLPVGWTVEKDGDTEYYFHKDTDESSWTFPTEEAPEGWKLEVDEEGTEYFYNEESEESAWKTTE